MKNSDSYKGAKLPSEKLDANAAYLRTVFAGDDALILRYAVNREQKFCLVYEDGMVNNKLLNEDVIKPLLEFRLPDENGPGLLDTVAQRITFVDSVEKTADLEKLIQGIVYGDTVLLMDGCSEALILNTKGFLLRSISEPESERVLRGPREGFVESILVNLSLVRRRLRTPDFKVKYRTFGKRTKTKAALCYLDSLVNRDVLAELERRLDKLDIDGTLDSNYITEQIRDAPFSAIKTVGSTERPDVVAGKLLEGRIALFLDGTPVVLTVPHLFIEHFQSDEDYYLNYVFATIGRILRLIAFVVSVTFPAVYVAMVTFHQEMVPTQLLLSTAAARQGMPFPTALETFLMLVVFEMLRESGARMPGIMGQTLSIVGALVIGQAAVQARFVSAPIIIIVGLAGICGLMVPRIKGYMIMHRFFLLACACIFGLYGILLGIILLLVGIYGIRSFGIPIVPEIHIFHLQNYKDIFVRSPWPFMVTRPKGLSKNRVRQKSGDKP